MTLRKPLILCVGILLGLVTGRATADTSHGAERHVSTVRTPATSTSTASTTTTQPQPSTTAARDTSSIDTRRLRSTAYCLTGRMANGLPTFVGAVAANRYPLGTILHADPNPWGQPAMTFVVADRHKPGATELDFAMPGECSRALRWGNRRHVTVRVIG